MGIVYRNNEDLTVSYEFKSKISDLWKSLFKLKKILWATERKSHNRIENAAYDSVKSENEITRHWCMMDKDVSPLKATSNLEKFIGIANVYLSGLVSSKYKEHIKQLIEDAEMLIVTIKLSDHEPSDWSRLK